MQIFRLSKTDLKTVLYCQKCLYGVYNAQRPQNFPGAAPPDPCRSSLGGARATSLAPRDAKRSLGGTPARRKNGSLRSPNCGDLGYCYCGEKHFWKVRPKGTINLPTKFGPPTQMYQSSPIWGYFDFGLLRGYNSPTFRDRPGLDFKPGSGSGGIELKIPGFGISRDPDFAKLF